LSRLYVVNFQKPRPPATRRLATVLISCQNLSSNPGRDCGPVTASVFADGGIATHPLGFGSAQLAFTSVGLDGHSTSFCIFVDMDLDRRSTGEVPPGALLAL
jgi:hypothetical protein